MARGQWLTAVLVSVLTMGLGAPTTATAAPSPRHDRLDVTRIDGAPADAWSRIAAAAGLDATAVLQRLGASGMPLDDLTPAPQGVVEQLLELPVLRAVKALERVDSDGEPAEEDAEASPPHVAAGPVPDVTGDGVRDLWITRSRDDRQQAQLVDAVTGNSAWALDGPWWHDTPVAAGDVDGDGVTDLAVVRSQLLEFGLFDESNGDTQRLGVEATFLSGVAVLSGADGAELWSEQAEETFGLAFRFTESSTEWWFGIEIWLEDAIATPRAVTTAAHGAELAVERVSQHASAEIGGRGAYVWNSPVPVDGVTLTSRLRSSYRGATAARVVDARSGVTRLAFEVEPGPGVGFLRVVKTSPAAEPRLAWIRYDLPDFHMECVALVCPDPADADVALTVEVSDGDGTLRWAEVYEDRYDIGMSWGGDLTGDGVGEFVVLSFLPDGDTYRTEVTAVDWATGAQQWTSSLGPTDAGVLDVLEWDGDDAAVLLYEIALPADGFGVRLHRLDGATGTMGQTTEHFVEDPPGSSGTFLDSDPYVWGTSSVIVLDHGGDSDGDGRDDVLISLWQQRQWSDDRPDTYWGRWTVESAVDGSAIHAFAHEQPLRYVTGGADTSGDGRAEVVERTEGSATVLDGATAAPLWQLPEAPAGMQVVDDLTGDGAADLLQVVPHNTGADVTALEGPTRRLLWQLMVAGS